MSIRHLGSAAGTAGALFLLMETAQASTFGYIANYARTNGAARSQVVQTGAQSSTPALARDSNGKIIVVTNLLPTPSGFVVGRYNADYSADTTFGYLGVTTVDLAHDGSAVDVTVDGENSIYVLGSAASGPTGTSTYVAKFRSGGALDPTWGNGGIATLSSTETPYKMALYPGASGVGVIWARGNGSQGGFHVGLLSDQGTPIFSRTDSFVAMQPGDVASSIAFDNFDNIFVVGQSGGQVAIREYESQFGSHISSYNQGKALLIDFGRAGQRATDVATDSSGNVLVVGGVTTQTNSAEFLLAKTDYLGNLTFRRDFVRGGAPPPGVPGVSKWSVLISGSFYWVAGAMINDNGLYQQNLFKIYSATFDFQTDFAHSGWMHDGIGTYGTSVALDIALDPSANPILSGFVAN